VIPSLGRSKRAAERHPPVMFLQHCARSAMPAGNHSTFLQEFIVIHKLTSRLAASVLVLSAASAHTPPT